MGTRIRSAVIAVLLVAVMVLGYFKLSPIPPETLCDQVHTAYASAVFGIDVNNPESEAVMEFHQNGIDLCLRWFEHLASARSQS